MRIFLRLLAILALSTSAIADTLIKNVTVITMNGNQTIENAVVYTAGDRIAYVGTANGAPVLVKAPEIEIDGTGKFLVPGLAEMHGHLPSTSLDNKITKETLFLYLAGGVTTVRGMLGNPIQFEMRKAIADGTVDGPTLYLAAPSLNGNTVSSSQDGINKVKRYHADGYDLLKIHPGLTRGEYTAIADAANVLGIPFGGHVPEDVGIELALEKKQTSIDHLDGFIQLVDAVDRPITDAELTRIVEVYKAYEPSWIVPTQALFAILIAGGNAEVLAARPENAYMPARTRANWARRIKNTGNPQHKYVPQNRQKALRALAVAGARIVMGSDAPQLYSVPGFSLQHEVNTLLEAGFTPAEILKISTRNAGDYFADKDQFGQIIAGMRADLLLLDADPRHDAMNLFKQTGVMAAGRWYSRTIIDKQLAEIAAANK